MHQLQCTNSNAPTPMHQLQCTNSHAPTLMHQHSCTNSHAPTLMHQLSCTNSHAPTPMHQLQCTNSNAPTPMYQLSCTNSHAPTLMHQHSCTNSHAPTLMHQLSCTNSHAPTLMHQLPQVNSRNNQNISNSNSQSNTSNTSNTRAIPAASATGNNGRTIAGVAAAATASTAWVVTAAAKQQHQGHQQKQQGRNYHWTWVDKVQGAPEPRGPPSPRLNFFKEQYFVNKIQNSRCNSTLTLRQWLHPSICVMRLLQYATIESFSGWLIEYTRDSVRLSHIVTLHFKHCMAASAIERRRNSIVSFLSHYEWGRESGPLNISMTSPNYCEHIFIDPLDKAHACSSEMYFSCFHRKVDYFKISISN